MRKYDLIILGATVYGIAKALKAAESGKKALIIERLIVCGYDFTGGARTELPSIPSSKLYSAMEAHNLIGEAGCHIFPVSGILAGMLNEASVDVLLSCEVLSYGKCADGFKVSVFSEDGEDEFLADNLINTDPRAFAELFEDAACERFLCATLICGFNSATYTDEETDAALPLPAELNGFHNLKEFNFKVWQGRFPKEYVLGLKLSPDEDYQQAKRRFYELWSKYYLSFKPYDVAAISAYIQYRFNKIEKRELDGVVYVASSSYPDVAAAFEGGYNE